MGKLTDMKVTAVALVDHGANRRNFALLKMDNEKKGERMSDFYHKYSWLKKSDKFESFLKALSEEDSKIVSESMEHINVALSMLAGLMGYPSPVAASEIKSEDFEKQGSEIQKALAALWDAVKELTEAIQKISRYPYPIYGKPYRKPYGYPYPTPSYPSIYPKITEKGEIEETVDIEVLEKIGRELSRKNLGLLKQMRDLLQKILIEAGEENPIQKAESLLKDEIALKSELEKLEKSRREKADSEIISELEKINSDELSKLIKNSIETILKKN